MRAALLALIAASAWAQAVECGCDHASPGTIEARACGLCQEAEKRAQAGSFEVFFLKDTSPRKPNRTLALPVRHPIRGQQDMRQLTVAERAIFWRAAMAKAQEMWPDAWGLAINSDTVRTQCHLHIHMGKLNEGVDEAGGQTVESVEQIPAPESGLGIWLHPVTGGFHVHTDREIAEPALMR